MDTRSLTFNSPFFSLLEDLLDLPEDQPEKSRNNPSRAYVRDAKAMAATPADVVEGENVLVVSGERNRDKEKDNKEGVKYVRMERRVGKFMRKFALPENANMDAISALAQDGVLTVTVEKLPPPEPKKPKTIEVQVA
ncbi:hypothetical protein Patl1_13818 [Pistacia atlantica]|uniref:Uncharacterized protein n=1 Tax=Pistacia atlantica TaxID=434234 RepID=A0ACC1AXQ9_9ROSI|nr:hypothetical protein Patl1_13818 [Pistacia atlantica]